jgi:phosphoribosylformimino-5-aminoimidazole carboxamide ribotide isomerase
MLMPEFIVFPAIDLRRGQVVRLKEGDPARQTTYAADPAAAARRWLDAGAAWLHVVNLDGAFDEADAPNLAALNQIMAAARPYGARIQFGGGLRSLATIQNALEAGVTRVILGTLAVEQPEVLAEALRQWGPERVGAGLDARDGQVMLHGWQKGAGLSTLTAAQAFRQAGLHWLVFTDIARDGLQTGLNLDATLALSRTAGLAVIASGGVAALDDVLAVRQAGLAGVIVGRALYEGKIDPQALFASPRPSGGNLC